MTDQPKDRYGFPLVPCARCGGSGRFSFNQIDGDRCYGCGGTGWRHPRGRVADAVAAFQEARRVAAHPTVDQLAVGDVITFDMNFSGRVLPNAVWAEVTSIVVTDEPCGWTASDALRYCPDRDPRTGYANCNHSRHPQCWQVTDHYHVLTLRTLTDDVTRRVNGKLQVLRRAQVDVTPFLRAAGVA